LDPYYNPAGKILNLGPGIYDERVWQILGVKARPLDPSRVRTDFWQFRSA